MTLTWRMTRGAAFAAVGLLAGVVAGTLKELLAVRSRRVCRAMTLDWLASHCPAGSPAPASQGGTLQRDDLDMEDTEGT